jgi:hypothetical protein
VLSVRFACSILKKKALVISQKIAITLSIPVVIMELRSNAFVGLRLML